MEGVEFAPAKAERAKENGHEELHASHPVHRGAVALAVAFTVSLPLPAHADQGGHITPPPVPDKIQVAEGSRRSSWVMPRHPELHLPALGRRLRLDLFTPEATLFERPFRQAAHHPLLQPQPGRRTTPIRATWQHSRDTSTVWAKVVDSTAQLHRPRFVAAGAIPWVLLEEVGVAERDPAVATR